MTGKAAAFLAVALLGPAPAAMRAAAWGVAVEAYPAGVQCLAALETPLNPHWAWRLDAGWNEARRWDWGLHEDERGGGPGLGAGLRWTPATRPRLFVGVESQLWLLPIAWRQGARTGLSRTVVLQPALELGWRWALGPRWTLEPTVSLGQEINVATEGEAVGQGPILRVGIGLLNKAFSVP